MAVALAFLVLILIGSLAAVVVAAFLQPPSKLAAEIRKPKYCGECKYFDLEAGQQAMARNPAFVRVLRLKSPYELNRQVEYVDEPCPDCDPAGNEACSTCCGQKTISKAVDVYPEGIPPNARWEDYGVCLRPEMTPELRGSTIYSGGKSVCNGEFYEPERSRRGLRVIK